MHKTIRQLAITATALMLMASVAVAAELPNFVELAKKSGPAVVNISTERTISAREGFFPGMMPPGFERFFEPFGGGQPQQQKPRTQSSLGSGFIISADGYIVTNNHVVEGADKVFVNLQGETEKGKSLAAKVIGTDPETDLALLKVESDKPLPVLPFGDSDSMEVGEWVVAIGNPFGLSHTVTSGILSAKDRDIHSGSFDNFLQTDASINPGNSGGPLINMKGEVIGINTAIIASGQGIGFAIPSSNAARIVADLKEGKKVSRGWIGVTIQDVDDNTAKALGMKNSKGALIGSVLPNEPAAKAGLEAGDIIIKVGKDQISNAAELLRSIASYKPESKVEITVMRNGKEKTVTVTLGERASKGESGKSEAVEKQQSPALGIAVRPLQKDDTRALQLPADTKGLLVMEVDPSSPSAEAGLQSGDVVLSANLNPVSTVEELANIVNKEGKERGAVMLQLNRKGQTFFVTIPLEEKK